MEPFPNVTTTPQEASSSFLMTTLNYSSDLHPTSLDPRDYGNDVSKEIEDINDLFRQIVYLPLTSFGLLGNALSVWVWSAETVYNSSVFMLKALAVWDGVFCLVHLIHLSVSLWTSLSPSSFLPLFLTMIVILSQICSVYTTLLSSVTRLLAIFRPARFNTILSRPRIVALCVAIFLWSLLLTSLEISWYVCVLADGAPDCQHIYRLVDYYRKHYLYDLFAFCVPSFLLLSCNILIVWKFSRHRSEMSGSSTNQKSDDKTRRLSITMITISVTSLVSFPVAVSVRLGLNPGQLESDTCDLKCYYIVAYFCGALTIFNSCINVVYYYVISSRFRELLRFRVGKLCERADFP